MEPCRVRTTLPVYTKEVFVMKMKRVFAVTAMVLAAVAMFAASAFALSDAEYLKMKKNSPAFARADKALGQAWKEVQKVLSKSDFNRLKNEQKKWIAKGRDDEAEAFMEKPSTASAICFARLVVMLRMKNNRLS